MAGSVRWQSLTREQQKADARQKYEARSPQQNYLFAAVANAANRARKKGVPFDRKEVRRVAEEFAKRYFAGERVECPYLGLPLKIGAGKLCPASPTVERVVPERGYVAGNVIVVSHKANLVKNNATPDELERIAQAIREHQQLQELLS